MSHTAFGRASLAGASPDRTTAYDHESVIIPSHITNVATTRHDCQ
jgi:hypothetical protein